MKTKIILLLALASALTGCATNKAYLPHIPKDVEVTNLEVNINSPWGGSTVVKAESYKSSNE